MDVNNVGSASQTTTASTTTAKASTTAKDSTTAKAAESKAQEAVVYEKSKSGNGISSAADKEKVNKLLEQTRQQTENFQRMIMKLLQNQGKNADRANSNIMVDIDDETRAAAKEAIGEDGYYGVKKTSGRILDFAKAFAGDDPEKLQTMKDAFLKGFEAARSAWGGIQGKLPQICEDTYDAVMAGFDELMGVKAAE